MFNSVELMINHFVDLLRRGYRRNYGNLFPEYESIIAWAGAMAMENIANSDALYHDVEHSIMVTLVGQEVLRGKHIARGGVDARDWMHFIVSLLCHDIGYVRGVCREDQAGAFADGRGGFVHLKKGASDASLTPYHVDRGKLFVEERFGGNAVLDVQAIKRNIELTRFPVPSQKDQSETDHYPGLVRASDLIGQLSDPRYLQKINKLYGEFVETGTAKELGYKNPGDLRTNYPRFYWKCVYPFIKPALRYLSVTQEGKQITANLYAHIFTVEHESDMGELKDPRE